MFFLTLSLKAPLGWKDTGRLGLKPLMLQGQNTARSEHHVVTLCTINIILTLLSKSQTDSQTEKHRSQSCSCTDAWGQMRFTKILTLVSGILILYRWACHLFIVLVEWATLVWTVESSLFECFWLVILCMQSQWILKSRHRSLSFPLDRKLKCT